jgi:hypothetical protein
VGGLSGIDYDAANDEWVMISDDRSQINRRATTAPSWLMTRSRSSR